MKKINQYNQWLLERYPTLWNTRIVWMLLISFLVHLVFFAVGYFSHSNPKALHSSGALTDYYSDGIILVHLIVSILLLVGWCITMFKNNAFKNFYPTSRWSLYFQFVQYFVIIFAAITFYFSFMLGFKTYIMQKYDDDTMAHQEKIVNTAHAFLPFNINDYTLNNRMYPKIFSNLYCEDALKSIDKSKPYLVYFNQVYQFYTTYKVVVTQPNTAFDFAFPEKEKNLKIPLAYSEVVGREKHFYFKKDLVDITPYITSTRPNFGNYSSVFYMDSAYPYDSYNSEINSQGTNEYKALKLKISADVNALLAQKDPKALQDVLTEFLTISEDYKIDTNIKKDAWYQLIKRSKDNDVAFFIKNQRDDNYENVSHAALMASDEVDNEVDKDYVRQFNPNIDQDISPDQYYKNNVVNLYYDNGTLKNLLVNVQQIKSKDFFDDEIHIYLWMAFALSALIFSFRIAGLRSLLFSIISGGVITLGVILISVMAAFSGEDSKLFVLYLCFLVGLSILLWSIFGNRLVKKTPATIAMVIMINVFPVVVLLLFGIIDMHQEAMCHADKKEFYRTCTTITDWLGIYLSYVVLILSFVFLYCYTAIIQKWKSLPE